jgi:methyltransferase (TIGR00027 family)
VPRCHRVVIAVDLREDWRSQFVAAGFQPATPTVWLLEGLLIYLTADEATTLLQAVTGLSTVASRLGCEGQASDTRPRPSNLVTPRLAQFTEMWKGGLGRALPQWLSQHGWQVRIEDRDSVADAYGRPSPVPSDGGYLISVRTDA